MCSFRSAIKILRKHFSPSSPDAASNFIGFLRSDAVRHQITNEAELISNIRKGHSNPTMFRTASLLSKTKTAFDQSLKRSLPMSDSTNFQWRIQVRSFASHSNTTPNTNFSKIGERARAMQQKRLWRLALGGTVTAGFIIIVLNTFQENLMYYITPSEALQKFNDEPSKNRFRLGGLVLEGSVKHFSNSTEMEFVVTDLITEILVRYRGSLPGLFREGHSVVVEGFLKPFTDEMTQYFDKYEALNPNISLDRVRSVGCFFSAAEVLAKHDEKYMPKEVALALERNKAALEEKKKEEKDQANQADEEQSNSLILRKEKAIGGDDNIDIGTKNNSMQTPIKAKSTLSKVAQSPKQSREFDLSQ